MKLDPHALVNEALENLRPILGDALQAGKAEIKDLGKLTAEQAAAIRPLIEALRSDVAGTLQGIAMTRDEDVRAELRRSLEGALKRRQEYLTAAVVANLEHDAQRAYERAMEIALKVFFAAAKAVIP